MSKEVAVVAVHGMGSTGREFAKDLIEELEDDLSADEFDQIYVDTVYYQDILELNQMVVYQNMTDAHDLDYEKLRKFLLFGFSDAAGLERYPHAADSPYIKAQTKIQETLKRCARPSALDGYDKPVIFVAHSLGCQVISNYIWDSQAANAAQGVWKGVPPTNTPEDNFLRMKTLSNFSTTGCNIPILLAGLSNNQIQAINVNGNGYNIKWDNYFDKDDVLGWPLKPLSTTYKTAIRKDVDMNAAGGFWGRILRGWNPVSHDGYWTDDEFIEPLIEEIRLHL